MRKIKKTGILSVIIAILYIALQLLMPEEYVSDNIVETNAFVEYEQNLQVHFIDVDQADAILITQGKKAMLIDAGENATKDIVKDYITEQGITKLDYVIGTHPHSDHIGAMYYIIDNFEVEKALLPDKTHTSRVFEKFITSIKNNNVEKIIPEVGDEFTLGDAKFEIIGPTYASDYGEELNNYSIVVKLTFGNKTFLFTGDAESKSEKDILATGVDLKCDLLKLGHHGSSSSTTEEFFKAVNPKYAVISVGKDNKHDLPDGRVMNMLKENNIPVYRTDEAGTIVATCNGNEITIDKPTGTYSYID